MSSNINFKATHFEYSTLTKIYGPPTYETLTQLTNELKANASSVPSSLGGGAHGHLGLVIPPSQYALLSNIPYVRPRQPPPFFLPQGTDPQVAQMLRESHVENVRAFRECIGVENALKQQLVTAVDTTWLAPLRNPISNSITMPIVDVIQYLYQVHGKITPDIIHEKETVIATMTYDPLTPIDHVFTAVQELTDMAAMAGVPYSIPQTINMAYRVINNTRKFGIYINEWNRKPPMEKNWLSFKTFFRRAHEELKETTDLTAQETPFQANAIQEIIQGLKEELMGLHNTPDYVNYASDVSPRHDDISSLHDEIASLKSTISSMQQSAQPATSYRHTDTAQYVRSPVATPSTRTSSTTSEKRSKQRTFKYCWTHGVCSHDSKSCERKAQNHVDDATFDDMKGGSLKGIKRYKRDNT